MSEKTTFDLIVVGGGPAGYQAAFLAGRGGLNVLLIEAAQLGGTCLNRGCIPTKTLLKSAKLYKEMGQAADFGLSAESVQFHLDRVQARKREIIASLSKGIKTMLAMGRVTLIEGQATVVDVGAVVVNSTTYTAPNLLICTGATPIHHPNYPNALTTTQVLELESVPESMGILGSNPISFGVASIFSMMGTRVTIAEPGAVVLPEMDADLRRNLLTAMKDVQVVTNTTTLEAEVIVVNLGRTPNLEAVNSLALNIDGGICTDEHMRTNLPGVYAAGDVTGQAMWAHVALREAQVAVNHMLGVPDRIRYHAIPTPVYTVPEAAYVGLSEEQAKEQGYTVKIYRLPMSANGRFLIEAPGQTGQCKVITDANNRRLLGVHILGGNAAEMIFGVAAMLEDEFRVEDLRDVVFAHPTVSELFHDVILM